MSSEHDEFVLMQKLARVLQTTPIELIVREMLSYDACEQETCTDLCKTNSVCSGVSSYSSNEKSFTEDHKRLI